MSLAAHRLGGTVFAVVLTYDAHDALHRCLAALAAQTRPPDLVLVVDNASPEPVVVVDPQLDVRVLRRDLNDGPAGGHTAGLCAFLESGADAAWVMDDDCVPEPGCLDALLAASAAEGSETPLFPLWVDAPSGDARFLPAWCGVLFPRGVVERIGLPRTDFVWWAEDTEYMQSRLIDHGLTAAHVSTAVVSHQRVRISAVKPTWKLYYEVRNTIIYRRRHQVHSRHHRKLLVRSLYGLAFQAARPGPHRFSRLVAYGRGLIDGATGRTGQRMALPGPYGRPTRVAPRAIR